jgi:magnesium-transporting ATPase (P-type)
MILADDDYVARREGSLIAIEKDVIKPTLIASSSSASPPSSAPPPDALPTASKPQDRVLTGGSTRIEKDEVVRDVVVFGGSADVFGTATGDVTVIGGSARIHRGAHVMGDATAVGGSLHVDDGSRVDGDVGVVGGVLRRGDTAQIGGRSASNSMGEKDEANEGNAWPWYRRVLTAAGRAIAEIAVLFLLGSVFLALASSQMRELQAEVAARPMRSLALGIVGTICFAALLLALTISVVGIPIAIVALLLVIMGAYAGVTSVLAVLGSALLGHRTRNPYTHLALGCLLFLLAKALPLLGTIVLFVVVLLGFGTIVATRGASLLAKRSRV